MRIIIDAMGSDKGPEEFVRGAIMAIEELDVDISFVGKEQELSMLLEKHDHEGKYRKSVEIINATEVIEMEDDPLSSMKEKPDSSMRVALTTLADGKGDALISAGNTGALLTQATLIVKRIKGIRRAALAPLIPTATGQAILIDSGANAECTSEYLYQFALMGAFYMENTLGIKSPKVGLLNNGAEEHKGDTMHREAYKLLKKAGEEGIINFVGNVEGRGVPMGEVDVIVADGFSGNILLKTIEGTAAFFVKQIKGMFMSSKKGLLAGLLVKSKMGELKAKLDHNSAGGAPFLGIRKPVIKLHGSAGYKSVYSGIAQALDYIDSGTTIRLASSLEEGKKIDE